ncbi:aminopeptidase N [Modicisalibacter luteus]|uniref:Aminopeptidase N n=1 Tax=Modicisalibacter luteus TaxID=453962 RepID=A0ABV7M0S2_9GAMM|nr:aminopeptidase N [Halomonas lutea]GHA95958.1 aminopeptidase N [Halomonas lutea]
MSDTRVSEQAEIKPVDAQPQPVYLKDYRPPAYRVTHTELKFDLSATDTQVHAALHLERHPDSEPGLPLTLHGEKLSLKHIAIDGQELQEGEYQVDDATLTIPEAPDRLRLETVVVIDPQANTALEGLYLSNGMFCTQCEAEGFRRITYYLDRPDVMATFSTTVIGDREQLPVLLSNGNPVERGELPNGKHFVTWEDPHPKPSYLFALVAGQLEKVEDHFTTMSGRDVTLQLWVESENLDKTEHAMRSLKASMKWDEETYGREYDLDLFMIVAVNDFNMGAMENKGLNIFNSAAVLTHPQTATDGAFQRVEGVVAHEYFHNWSGNRVTCRDWFQLSLKEGFTVFRDQSFSADVNSAPVKRIQDVSFLRTAQFAEDAGPTAHPVRPDHYIEISNFYTLTIYEKGSEIVRMLRNLLGWDTFRKGSDLYFERFDGQAVTIEDFVGCMAEVSGLDLDQFMRWYSQAGTPEIDAHGEYDYANGEYRLTLRQRTPATPGQPDKQPLHIPVRVGLVGTKSGEDLTLTLEGPEGKENLGKDGVLHLREDEQTFVFTNVAEAPVPSLLRGFSAPVKLRFPYGREDLAFLLQNDSDGFNRWDAGQRLAMLALDDLIAAHRNGVEKVMDPRVTEAFRSLLNEPSDDKAVLAEMLTLPSEAYIAEQQPMVDVDAIHAARNFVKQWLAVSLRDEFLSLYRANQSDAPYAPDAEQIAQRSLKNVALSYLMSIEDEEGVELARQQFEAQHNMTDVRAALTLLVHSSRGDIADPALRAFGEKWAHDPLVMDQWFSVQVTRPQSDALDRVKYLMDHPAFSLKNPNRVRALIGAFVGQNRVNFHRLDGEGYKLLSDVVIELNRLNPEIAARIITPLTRWQRFDEQRQALMKAELERIRAEDLSPNVYEVVEKALAN